MNKLIKPGFAVLVITALNGCTLQEDTEATTTQGAIRITAQTEHKQSVLNVPGTKTTLNGVETHWKGVDNHEGNADKIGIFSPEAKATSDGTTAANPAKNLAFTAQISAKSSNFTGTMFWGDNADHHFYAYYPRNSGFAGERTVVPISLPSAQIQSAAGNTAHIGALDFMVATPDTVQYGEAVNFTFNHVFALIEFKIVGIGELTKIRLAGADPLACEGTIDISQVPSTNTYEITTSGITKNVTVNLSTPVSLSGTPVSVYMMVLPGIQIAPLKIAIKTDGAWKEMEKEAIVVDEPFTRGTPDRGFIRGKKYDVILNTTDEGWNAAFEDSRDNQIYKYVTIGEQVWMAENLAYLPSVVGPATGSETEPYYYVYDYEGTSVNDAKATTHYFTYGVLYNWPAAMDGDVSSSSNPSGVQGICPSGWHLPSDAEWTTLTDYLGGIDVAGDKMKEEGTSHWTSPNTGATNESGFSALPGGYRNPGGTFNYFGSYGFWWSSTQSSAYNTWYRYLYYSYSGVNRYNNNKSFGYSVRCIRD